MVFPKLDGRVLAFYNNKKLFNANLSLFFLDPFIMDSRVDPCRLFREKCISDLGFLDRGAAFFVVQHFFIS